MKYGPYYLKYCYYLYVAYNSILPFICILQNALGSDSINDDSQHDDDSQQGDDRRRSDTEQELNNSNDPELNILSSNV